MKAQVVLMPNQKSGILGGVRYAIHMNANAIKINFGFVFVLILTMNSWFFSI